MYFGSLAAYGVKRIEADSRAEFFQLSEAETTAISPVNQNSITLCDCRRGLEIADARTTPEQQTETRFLYPDGTLLMISDGELIWPRNSLLPGSILLAAPSHRGTAKEEIDSFFRKFLRDHMALRALMKNKPPRPI